MIDSFEIEGSSFRCYSTRLNSIKCYNRAQLFPELGCSFSLMDKIYPVTEDNLS